MGRLLKDFLIVFACIDRVLFLHVQVAQAEVNIGEKELFLDQLICLIEVLFCKLKSILLDTEVTQPMGIVTSEQFLIQVDKDLKLLVRSDFTVVTDDLLE